MFDVADDPDNYRLEIEQADVEMFADGILARKVFSRETGVDNGGRGRTLVVARIKETAALERNAHGLRIAGSDEIEQRERHFVLVGGFRLSFDPKGNFGAAGHGERATHQRNALDTGNILKTAQGLAVFGAKLVGGDIGRRGERHVIRQHLARIESGMTIRPAPINNARAIAISTMTKTLCVR